MAILMAMKRVSVAEAKNTLPALLHEAEAEPVEIVRRGEPVAVLLSRAEYDRLRGKSAGVWASLERFRARHGDDLDELDAAGAFEGQRDQKPGGRPVRW
jgi:prevent-host-death family protein